MLSLFGWRQSSNHETYMKDKMGTTEDQQTHQKAKVSPSTPETVKRKRGKSTQSVARPTKKSSKHGKETDASDIKPSVGTGSMDISTLTPPQEPQDDAMDWSNVKNVRDLSKANANADSERLAKLRAAISRQFNLEILLKHNELRLIDQEIAKVQVSLEQLRRCSVVPYPATTSSTEDMLNVAHASGIPAPAQPGLVPATQPPPWGVVDGPYSRHYAKWLLPDPIFDGALPQATQPALKVATSVPERHTRGGKELALPMTKARQRPGPVRYQAVGSIEDAHKQTKGPMILKRNMDGKLVKLVCSNCNREDFNSAQGFINHCRIAHGHNLASHEAAARECGVEVDPSEVVLTVPESATTTTPIIAPQPAVVVGVVHPMNRAQPAAVPKLSLPRPKKAVTQVPKPLSKLQASTSGPSDSFKPSDQVPHLSKLFAKLGKAIDLTAAVEDATTKPEPEANVEDLEMEEDGEDEEDGETTPTTHNMARIPSRVSARGGPMLSNSRPKSRKGPERGARQPYDGQAKNTQITLPEWKDSQDLSPNTITSANAPSLISDSDDESSEDEHGSNAGHQGSYEESNDEGSHTEDIDIDMDNVVSIRGGFGEHGSNSSAADTELQASSKARNQHNTTASGRARSRMTNGNSRHKQKGKGRQKRV